MSLSVHKHFGDMKDISCTQDLKERLVGIQTQVTTLLNNVYNNSRPNVFSSDFSSYLDDERRDSRSLANSPSLVILKISEIFAKELKGSSYLRGVRMDESSGKIVRSDIERYMNAYYGFLELFTVQKDTSDYSIIKDIELADVEIPLIREFKLKYICDVMKIDREDLDERIKEPLYKYSKLDMEIDKEYVMYELFIDASKRITYSNFYNTYVMESFNIVNKPKESIIYKLSDIEFSYSEYFNYELKQYMTKENYERVISKYVGAFDSYYKKDLFKSIKEDPIITRYLVIKAVEEMKNFSINKNLYNGQRLDETLSK